MPPESVLARPVLLVDTSVWIEVFRRPSRIRLEPADLEEMTTCLPIVQEVLQGFTDDRAYRIARDALFALPMVESPLGHEVFEDAVGLYRAARRAGVAIRSSVDCLIAACAIRRGLTVLHRDRDFDELAHVSPLRAREAPLG